MPSNRSLRQRLRAIPYMLRELAKRPDADQKNGRYSLLLSYGYYLADWFDAVDLNSWQYTDNDDKRYDAPLTFAEATSRNTWFVQHPEKVCGAEIITTSREFPVSIVGTKDDIIRAIRAGMKPADPGRARKLKVMSLKAKAILILQQQEAESHGSAGLSGYWVVPRWMQDAGFEYVGEDRYGRKSYWHYNDLDKVMSIDVYKDHYNDPYYVHFAFWKKKKLVNQGTIAYTVAEVENIVRDSLEPYNLSGLGFLGSLTAGNLSGLGKLADKTSESINDNKDAINAILDNQDKSKKYSKGDVLSFAEIVSTYNPGLTADEIKAWVWYKRSIGVPMSGWEAYYLKMQKTSTVRQVTTKPTTNSKLTEIRDNHFRLLGAVESNKLIGEATSKKLQYDRDTTYLIIKIAKDVLADTPAGSLVYVNQADVTVDKPADDLDHQVLTDLITSGMLFYCNGRLMPYPIYAYGNMYDRELQLNLDYETIRAKYGDTVALTQRHVIQAAKPRLISVQNSDPRERPKILAISDFAKDFVVFALGEDAGVDLQKLANEKVNGRGRTKADRDAMDAMRDRMDTQSQQYEYSLQDAFVEWMKTLPRGDFREVTAAEIEYYYLAGHALGKNLSDEQKDTINKYAPQEAEELFSRFLNEALTYEDKQKIDFSWNRTFNGYSSIPYQRVPVGFSCSAFFKRSLLQFTPAQREAIAFMEVAGSGCLAYDVGVGKTMSAIITLANSLTSGKCKRPIIAVPNPTYAKWLREIIGYTDSASGEFVPGVLSYTGITVNEWSNLGVDAVKKINFNKPVPEKSITVVTFEGLMKIGYSKKVMDSLFEELAKILMQTSDQDKSNRDLAKLQQKWREMLGTGNKGTLADIDALGFDYLVIDEAHNFKNIFDQVPTDGDGKKRFKITGAQSDRGVKAFFLTNFIQRTFGQNVMLLTATPFTNSPLEIFSMLSMIGYDSLKQMGITSLETFCETFVLQSLEYVNSYTGEIKLDNVVKSYNNRLVLQKLIHNHIAYKTGEEAGVKRPVKINLPRIASQQADGSLKKLPTDQQVVTYLQPTQNQKDNQERIEQLAKSGGPKALAAIGRALGQNLDNALSPYLYFDNADTEPTYQEFVENSPKILYAVRCIESVKKWHEERKQAISGQVIYMNRGKQFFPLIKEYLNKEVGYKRSVKHNNKTFDEVEFITSEVAGERKEAIKDAFLAGVVKIIIGTATIKEGIDLQENGTVLYNLYPDWNPTDIKQLEGRIWRQGNKFGYVRSVMPLVQNSMDVFVFQKLEEKTARINDIWYRADRGNVLDQESLDPSEIKFALFSDIAALVSIRVDQIKRELNRKYVVVTANIDALVKFTAAVSSYKYYQNLTRQGLDALLRGTTTNLLINWDYNERSIWRGYYTMQTHDAKKRAELKADVEEWVKDAQNWQSSAELGDKELIRVLERILRLSEKMFGNQVGSEHYRIVSTLSEFRQKLSEVRKTERTILIPRGMALGDDVAGLMEEYKGEKKALEAELSETNGPEYKAAVYEEIKVAKEKSAVAGALTEQRAEQFASLNYLLGYKAADVAADAYGLPTDRPASESKAESSADAPKSDIRARKLKLLKLKSKAILILQQQEAERAEYSQAA